MKERFSKIIKEYLPQSISQNERETLADKMAESLIENQAVIPDLKFGERIFFLNTSGKGQKTFQGEILGVSYMKGPDGKTLVDYVILCHNPDRIETVPEDELFKNEEDVKNRLLDKNRKTPL